MSHKVQRHARTRRSHEMSKEMAQSITLSPRVLVTTCQDDAFYDLEHLLDIEDSRVRPPSSPSAAIC